MILTNSPRTFFNALLQGPADTQSPNSDVTAKSSLPAVFRPEVYFVQDKMFSFVTSHCLLLCVQKKDNVFAKIVAWFIYVNGVETGAVGVVRVG